MKFSRLVFAAVALLLTGCATATAPRGSDTVAPTIQGEAFIAGDGVALPMRHWDADGAPRAIVIALHGMNDYSNAFDGAGKLWAKAGITTYAYDQRGFGRGVHPGLWPGGDALRQDFRDVVAALRARYPGVKLFALGESMGGAVVLTVLAQPDAPALDGVILESPAVWSRSDMPLSYRAALFLAAHLVPSMIVTGSGLKIQPSDNIPMLRALSRDPLVIKETRVDAVYGLTNLMDEARDAPNHLTATPPILFLYGKNDPIIPREPKEGVIAALGTRATVHLYDKGYHMLLRDLDGAQVAQDVSGWIAQRLAD